MTFIEVLLNASTDAISNIQCFSVSVMVAKAFDETDRSSPFYCSVFRFEGYLAPSSTVFLYKAIYNELPSHLVFVG